MVKPASIVLVTFSLGSGGAEKQLLWIARTLARAGHRCCVTELVRKPGNLRLDNLVAAARNEGVEFRFAETRPSYARAWWRVRGLVRERAPNVIWSWGLRADLVTFLVRREHRQLRWISSLRSASREQIRAQVFWQRLISGSVHRYVGNTHLNCALLDARLPGVITRCRVLHNVVEELEQPAASLPPVPPNPLRVVMLGNVVQPAKGYDFAIEVAVRIARENLPIEIHIAGRPDAKGWLVSEIERHGLGRVLRYHGETGTPHAFLRSGHLYLLLSRVEGMPNALLEAASLGLPCIATKVGDLPTMAVDRDQMRLIEVGSVDAAYDAIVDARNRWPETIAMGRRGLGWCRAHFSSASCETTLLSIIREATDDA